MNPTNIEPWLNQIHCDDCLSAMGRMPSASVNLVVTSPPYNLLNSSGNGMKNGNGGKWSRATLMLQRGYAEHGDRMPHADYVEWQRECLREMLRVLTPDGAIFYNHKWRVQRGLLQDRADIMDGFPVRQIIIWQRSGGFNHNPGYFLPTYEVIYLVANPEFRLAPKAGGIGDVWQIRQDRGQSASCVLPGGAGATSYRGDHRRGGAGPVHRQRHHGDCRPDGGAPIRRNRPVRRILSNGP